MRVLNIRGEDGSMSLALIHGHGRIFLRSLFVSQQSHVKNSQWNSNPTNSFPKKNTLNDKRSFIFLPIISSIEKGDVIKRYPVG